MPTSEGPSGETRSQQAAPDDGEERTAPVAVSHIQHRARSRPRQRSGFGVLESVSAKLNGEVAVRVTDQGATRVRFEVRDAGRRIS